MFSSNLFIYEKNKPQFSEYVLEWSFLVNIMLFL